MPAAVKLAQATCFLLFFQKKRRLLFYSFPFLFIEFKYAHVRTYFRSYVHKKGVPKKGKKKRKKRKRKEEREKHVRACNRLCNRHPEPTGPHSAPYHIRFFVLLMPRRLVGTLRKRRGVFPTTMVIAFSVQLPVWRHPLPVSRQRSLV